MQTTTDRRAASLLFYAAFALLWSGIIWALFIPEIQNYFSIHLSNPVMWVGLFGPGLAAVVATLLFRPGFNLRELLAPFLQWRLPPIYYFIATIGVLYFYAATLGINALSGETVKIENFSHVFSTAISPLTKTTGFWRFLEFTIIYALAEELGWRGFALRVLLQRTNALTAALLISIVWTCWHMPLVFTGAHQFTMLNFGSYYLHLLSFSIFYSWLYIRTNKSLVIVSLFHGATDSLGVYFPSLSSPLGQGPDIISVVMEVSIALFMVHSLWIYREGEKCALRAKEG